MLKKFYLIISITALVFLAYQCGGNNSENGGRENESMQGAAAFNGNPAEGQKYFEQTCAACHGKDGKGLPKLGKDLTVSSFVQDKSPDELVKFIEAGRLPTDPLNTTGVAMPPKGGNPALTDQQIADIVSYVRSIHK